MRPLNNKELGLIAEATFRKTASEGLRHAGENLKYIKRTILDIRKELKAVPARPSIVISAGPSLHRRKSLEVLKERGFKGHIVTADGALGHCLRNGIVPDYVVTVDPHPHRVIRWFGDPNLKKRPADDYFKRQDLDPFLNRDEEERNEKLLALVNRHGRRIKAVISTSVCPEITRRCLEAGMELYWWNPIYDDYDKKGSVTRKICEMTKAPCMVTGGNVGSSAWTFASAVIGSPEILMVGMDFSYPPGTPVSGTQYYDRFKGLGVDPGEILIKIRNPYLKETWLTDPAYYWYSRNFLRMAKSDRKGKTYNCTEGGILFGSGVIFTTLRRALKKAGKI